jgi:hypothetical protein
MKRKTLGKDLLQHFEQTLVRNVGEYLVLVEEGTPAQIEASRNLAKSALLKYGPEMIKFAQQLANGFPEKVEGFLNQVDLLLHSQLDEAMIFDYYSSTQQLEHHIDKAA